MKQIVKAGLLALLLGGAVALPVQEAGAATRCREVIRHGVVVKRTCTTDYRGHYYGRRGDRDWDYRTVCNSYWRHGVKYRTCRRVYY